MPMLFWMGGIGDMLILFLSGCFGRRCEYLPRLSLVFRVGEEKSEYMDLGVFDALEGVIL